MRQSDIGPFGVLALVLAVLIDVAAVELASIRRHLARHRCAGRRRRHRTAGASCMRARQGVPRRRPGGFGALVAGSGIAACSVVQSLLVLGLGAARRR